MKGSRGIIGISATAAIFILLEIAALALLRSSSELDNIWLNRISHRCLAAAGKVSGDVADYFRLRKVNEKLSEDNSALLMELLQCRARLEELDTVCPVNVHPPYSYIKASILKLSTNSYSNYFVIDKGTEEGICPDCGVMTRNGVVGYIKAVDRHSSYGLTLMNPKVSVSARIGRDGIVSPLIWEGLRSDKGLLRDVPIHAKVERGDTVYTSGHSSAFPPDIPVGTIAGTKIIDGTILKAEVDLFQDFAAIRDVFVVINNRLEEVQEFESEEQ